ncbi:MAG: hypothetical protein BZ151_08140 [Desulfobacca sp. 4484_104]|nr:MAG: hypothetical protein BZ151_08140 [Desulfobacca sp. 4484_104]
MSPIASALITEMPLELLSSSLGSGVNQTGRSPADEQAIARVCQECEAVFLSMLMKQMRQSLLSGELAPQSQRLEQYWSLFDTEVSRHLAHSGGLGLGRVLSEQLQKDSLKSPSQHQESLDHAKPKP